MLGTAISRRDLPFPPESLEVDTLYKLSSIYSYAMTHHQPAHGLVLQTAHLVLGWFRKQLTCFRPGIGYSSLALDLSSLVLETAWFWKHAQNQVGCFENQLKTIQAASKTRSTPGRLFPIPDHVHYSACPLSTDESSCDRIYYLAYTACPH